MPELFAKSQVMGTFKGFTEKGLEFAAEIIAPYDSSMLERPQLGQFLLIQLESEEEASLGRITKYIPSGLLASAEGEDYVNTLQDRGQSVPEDLKKQKLKYRVQVKLLGAVKIVNRDGKKDIVFVPSQRRLPHLGAKVALPSDEVLAKICSLSQGETDLGDFVLGEFVYDGNQNDHKLDDMFRQLTPKLTVKFNINNLVSKRSVVFARAGYGKSNLIKYLISELYKNGVPKTEKGHEVGTLIFDAEGEYFWPDFKNRPGLCDVKHLQDHIVIFTNRKGKNDYYESWKAGSVKLDIRNLPARDVIGIAISADRQNQQNVLKLKSVNDTNWRELVDLIYLEKLQASDNDVGRLLGYKSNQISSNLAEIAAARSNMYNVVQHLHDPDSQLINGTIDALREGHIVITDISLLSSTAGYNIAGLLMRKIFSYNQENFTGGSAPIPVISVIEEAQSVLGKYLEETSPFVEWVKEGRKYDLGAILVTQQPGSMAPELLSQADNWFCFHLLSEGDAGTLGRYNSHFSHDILAHLIGEPIPGNCYMWSAPKQPFVLPVRIRNFENLYRENIKNDENEPLYKNSPAVEIKRRAEERYKKMKEDLSAKIRNVIQQRQRSFKKINDNLFGLYRGHLYHLVLEIKPDNEILNESQLMPILMNLILGEGNVKVQEYDGKEYYCAEKELWGRVMRENA
jgi:DNA helicase HerA-like ATPase